MKKMQIIDNIVTNIIEVNEKAIPDWCVNWPTATENTYIGGLYENGVFSPPPVDLEQLTITAREKRNTLLAASDWTQVEDAPVDKAAWKTYRQALRDITAQPGFPETIIWPEKP